MQMFSSTDCAIRAAHAKGTLRMSERMSRFGTTYVAIEDDFGTIEVQDTPQDAQDRVVFCTRSHRQDHQVAA